MPWFKDGAHDRVFNTLLNGALLVTDDSIYLRSILKDGENCIMFSLDTIEEMPKKLEMLLNDEKRLQQVIKSGYNTAIGKHTWKERAEFLSEILEKDVFAGISFHESESI